MELVTGIGIIRVDTSDLELKYGIKNIEHTMLKYYGEKLPVQKMDMKHAKPSMANLPYSAIYGCYNYFFLLFHVIP